MSDPATIPAHLRAVDPAQWPGIITVPSGRTMRMRARVAEAKFAKLCAETGINLSPDGEHDLVVDRAEVFARIAANGWTGFAEGYMAGEWRTETPAALVDVLRRLIEAGYHPRTPKTPRRPRFYDGEVPPELVARYSGDGISTFAGHFATGVPTTERLSVKSHAPGAGRGTEPASYFISVTQYGAPLDSEKQDLKDAQTRSVNMLLDAARVRTGTQVVELPSSGGAVAIGAAFRRATVDSIVMDDEVVPSLQEQLVLAGVTDSVHVSVVRDPAHALMRQRGSYDAVISVENMETLPPAVRVRRLAVMDDLLAPNGRGVIQSVVATDDFSTVASAALESLRKYVWPGLRYERADDLRRLADSHTELKVIASTHAPEHLQMSLAHQRATFQAQVREAAADGFDIVYRRLWTWQLALREALAQLGMLDVVQYTLAHRNRRGVR